MLEKLYQCLPHHVKRKASLASFLFIEPPGLTQLPLIAQDRCQPGLGRQIIGNMLQDEFILGCGPFQGQGVFAGAVGRAKRVWVS